MDDGDGVGEVGVGKLIGWQRLKPAQKLADAFLIVRHPEPRILKAKEGFKRSEGLDMDGDPRLVVRKQQTFRSESVYGRIVARTQEADVISISVKSRGRRELRKVR